MRTSSAEVFVPHLGRKVRVRPIPSRLLEVFARQARRPDGKVDFNEFSIHKFAYALVEPSFSVEETRRVFCRFGPSIHLVLDAIDRLSRTPDPVAPSHLRRTLRIAAQVAVTRKHQPRRGRAPRRACNAYVSSRRDAAGSRSPPSGDDDAGGEDDDGGDDHHLVPVPALLGRSG